MKILRGEPHKHTVLNKKHLHIYHIYIYINFVCHVQMSKYMYKNPRHLLIKKLYFGFFQTFKAYISISIYLSLHPSIYLFINM